jgi:hypothetical protein
VLHKESSGQPYRLELELLLRELLWAHRGETPWMVGVDFLEGLLRCLLGGSWFFDGLGCRTLLCRATELMNRSQASGWDGCLARIEHGIHLL